MHRISRALGRKAVLQVGISAGRVPPVAREPTLPNLVGFASLATIDFTGVPDVGTSELGATFGR
jgi:hypothetical protein